jgi:hypothetical protein
MDSQLHAAVERKQTYNLDPQPAATQCNSCLGMHCNVYLFWPKPQKGHHLVVVVTAIRAWYIQMKHIMVIHLFGSLTGVSPWGAGWQ